MCDYFYDVSERIAKETDLRRAEIGAIDRFLGRKHLREFKLQDAKACLEDSRLAEALLAEYIERSLLRKEIRYFCSDPEHTVAQLPKWRPGGRKVFCHKCDEWFSVRGLESETVYKRLRGPDRPVIQEDSTSATESSTPRTPWWKSDQFKITMISAIIIGGVSMCGIAITVVLHYNPVDTPTLHTYPFDSSATSMPGELSSTQSIPTTTLQEMQLTKRVNFAVATESVLPTPIATPVPPSFREST